MNDPPRLLEHSEDELVRSMLSAARTQTPGRRGMHRTLLALGATSGLLGGHTTAGATTGLAATSLTKLAAKWIVLGSLAVGGGTAVVEAVSDLRQYELPPVRSAGAATAGALEKVRLPRVAPPGVPPLVPSGSAQASEPTAAGAPEPPMRKRLPPGHSTAPNAASSASEAASGEQLAREVVQLDRARSALAGGNARAALDSIDAYLKQFAAARLEPEARYLKMQALRELGDRNRASAEAARLLELSPRGPHARAARELNPAAGALHIDESAHDDLEIK